MSASGELPTLELTGVLAATDSFERLRLCFVDYLETPRPAIPDKSWLRLRSAIPPSTEYNVPYDFPFDGGVDDAGVRGECWVTLGSSRNKTAVARRKRILALAAELRSTEVVMTVRPKRYTFMSQAAHNSGQEIAGTTLVLCSLEPLEFR